MNKSLIFVFFFLIATSVYSQTSSGNMMVGGGLEFNSRSHQFDNVNNFSGLTLSPSFGYFLRDNLAVGASLDLSSSRRGTGAGKTVYTAFGFGPFVRYYKFTSNENFAFFGNAAVAFSTNKTDPPAGGVIRGNAISFAVSPGAAYFFNEHWAMEISLALFSITSSDPDTANNNDKVTTVSFGFDSLSPGLGIRYHF